MSDPTESAAVFADKVLRQPLWPHQVKAAECDGGCPGARRTLR
jgi:hypothetical protein